MNRQPSLPSPLLTHRTAATRPITTELTSPPADDAASQPTDRPSASRRGFLATTLAALTTAFLPAPRVQARPPTQRRLLLNRFAIAGFRYHAGPRLLTELAPNQPLLLQAEPAHPKDHYAVRICWAGHLLGYVPRSDNHALSRLLRQNATLEARILTIIPDAAPWEQVQIEVTLIA